MALRECFRMCGSGVVNQELKIQELWLRCCEPAPANFESDGKRGCDRAIVPATIAVSRYDERKVTISTPRPPRSAPCRHLQARKAGPARPFRRPTRPT